jgi:hypothetical protein
MEGMRMISPLFKEFVQGERKPERISRERFVTIPQDQGQAYKPRAIIVNKREQDHQEDLMLFVRLVQKNKQDQEERHERV